MSTELRTIAVEGIDLSQIQGLNANLGVSFSKTTYFSKAMMRRYMEWACSRFNRLLVIVADHLEGHNARVFKRLPPDVALARALATGRDLRDGYRRAIPLGLAGRVRVALASELLAEPFCAGAVATVRRIAGECQAFRDDLAGSVTHALGSKIQEARQQGIVIDSQAVAILSNYLIEEIGIISYITHRRAEPYPVLLFPHFVPQVIRNVYQGKYGAAFTNLTQGHLSEVFNSSARKTRSPSRARDRKR